MTIKLARQAANLTQRQLADQANMNVRQIQKLESGEIKLENLTARNFLALALALGADPFKLIDLA